MTSSQSADPLIGRLVDGRYRVRARIARGGMATVYVATDLRLERRIALKVMHGHLSDDTVFQSRFIQEARAAARLADPNVVNVFDQGQDGDLAYLVMEYLPGITLRELVKEQRRLSITQTITVMDAVLSGLAAAHRAGIVHRDVKPENVLLAEDGRIKIGDFGLARATTANTATGQQLMGTIAYLAPELVTRGTADARSDIYSLGIMLYEMLAGEQPFRGEQPMAIAFQHATESVPRPSVRNPAVPEQLDELVLWSTEREPDNRPIDAQAMLNRLREIERELGVTPVLTRQESTMTAGLAIPEDAHTSGSVTTIMPMEPTGPMLATGEADTTDNATRLRTLTARKQRRGWWIGAVVLVLALLSGSIGWYFGSGPGSQVTIPQTKGTSEEAAMAALRDLGFDPQRREESSVEIEAGLVTRTDPEGGSRADANSAVAVYISTGPAEVTLPSLLGQTEQQARAVATESRLTVSDKTLYVFTASIPRDQVISVNVEPQAGGGSVDCSEGCTVHESDTVTFAISRGAFPDVVGKDIDEATSELAAVNVTVASPNAGVFTADIGKDKVAAVTGPEGRDWYEGDEVTLVISHGPVPDVSGESEADARKKLNDAGLTVASSSDTEYSDDYDKGDVIRIVDREGGGNWKPGEEVTLVVSLGEKPVAVPEEIIGSTIRDAMKKLRDAGLQGTSAIPEGILWDVFTVTRISLESDGSELSSGALVSKKSVIRLTSVG